MHIGGTAITGAIIEWLRVNIYGVAIIECVRTVMNSCSPVKHYPLLFLFS